MSLKIRRGLEADRLGIIPDEGEIIYTTDDKLCYVGDGVTAGGNLIGVAPTAGLPIATATGTVDAITATYLPPLTLNDKVVAAVVVSGANTSTTPTFAPDGLTAHTITKNGGLPLVAGDIPGALAVIILEYNIANTRWELVDVQGDTLVTEGALINSATAKATPVDADMLGLMDSAAANILKKLSWLNVKATLKTYFDTLYPSGSGTSTGTNTGDQTITLTGDVTGSGTGSFATTLASVIASATKGGVDKSLTITYDAKGRLTSVTENNIQITESQVTNLVSDLSNKQPLDSDLTTIASLTATTDNFIVSVASAWASRTVAQVKTTLGLIFGTTVGTYTEGNDSRLSDARNIKLAGYYNQDVTVTGTTANTYVMGLLVPSLTTNSVIEISVTLGKVGVVGASQWRVYYNTTNDLTGSPVQIAASSLGATNEYGIIKRKIANKNSLTSNYVFNATTNTPTDDANSGNARTALNVDLSGKYIIVAVQPATTLDTSRMDNFQITVRNP